MKPPDPRDTNGSAPEAHRLSRVACRGYARILMLIDGVVNDRGYKWGKLPVNETAHKIAHILATLGGLDLVTIGQIDETEIARAFEAAEEDANLRATLVRTGHERTDPLFRGAVKAAANNARRRARGW
jgi:hypothetical protein